MTTSTVGEPVRPADNTLQYLYELECIKAKASSLTQEISEALSVEDPHFFEKKRISINFKRNHLVDTWRRIDLSTGHDAFVIERINDTARTLCYLCSAIDNNGGASLRDRFSLGTAALIGKLSFTSLLGSATPEKPKPLRNDTIPIPEETGAPETPKLAFWRHRTEREHPVIYEDLQELPAAPKPELRPLKDLTEIFRAILEYWKTIKPLLDNNTGYILLKKSQLAHTVQQTESLRSEPWEEHRRVITKNNVSLSILSDFQSTLHAATALFLKASNAWALIATLSDSGHDFIATVADPTAKFNRESYLKLASIKIRLEAQVRLIQDRSHRYNTLIDSGYLLSARS